jgi:hypothetical protein
MDSSNQVIKTIEPIEYKKIKVILSSSTVVFTDLSDFSDVYCFPPERNWKECWVDSYGKGVIWSTRFEVHLDQILDYSYSMETETNVS